MRCRHFSPSSLCGNSIRSPATENAPSDPFFTALRQFTCTYNHLTRNSSANDRSDNNSHFTSDSGSSITFSTFPSSSHKTVQIARTHLFSPSFFSLSQSLLRRGQQVDLNDKLPLRCVAHSSRCYASKYNDNDNSSNNNNSNNNNNNNRNDKTEGMTATDEEDDENDISAFLVNPKRRSKYSDMSLSSPSSEATAAGGSILEKKNSTANMGNKSRSNDNKNDGESEADSMAFRQRQTEKFIAIVLTNKDAQQIKDMLFAALRLAKFSEKHLEALVRGIRLNKYNEYHLNDDDNNINNSSSRSSRNNNNNDNKSGKKKYISDAAAATAIRSTPTQRLRRVVEVVKFVTEEAPVAHRQSILEKAAEEGISGRGGEEEEEEERNNNNNNNNNGGEMKPYRPEQRTVHRLLTELVRACETFATTSTSTTLAGGGSGSGGGGDANSTDASHLRNSSETLYHTSSDDSGTPSAHPAELWAFLAWMERNRYVVESEKILDALETFVDVDNDDATASPSQRNFSRSTNKNSSSNRNNKQGDASLSSSSSSSQSSSSSSAALMHAAVTRRINRLDFINAERKRLRLARSLGGATGDYNNNNNNNSLNRSGGGSKVTPRVAPED